MARKLVCLFALAFVWLHAMPTASVAQSDYPNRAVRLVVPYPPGGANDLVWRTVADGLSKLWDQPVVVENRPGGATLIGLNFVRNAPSDGYTLIGHTNILAGLRFTTKMDYNPLDKFAAISRASSYALTLAVHPTVPASTPQEFANWLRSKRKEAKFAAVGLGSDYLSNVLLQNDIGAQSTTVQYKGSAQALTDFLNGIIQYRLDAYESLRPYADEGKLKIIATTSTDRFPLNPNVPTLKESGFPNVWLDVWMGLFANVETPKPILDKLNQDMKRTLELPQVIEKFKALGMVPNYTTSQKITADLRKDEERIGELAKQLDLQPE